MSKLEIKNLNIEVDGNLVVEDASLSVSSGEIHVLMGQNGSGKSSLLNAVMGHPNYGIKKGEILLDGDNITNLKTEEKAKKGLFLSMQYIPEIAGVSVASFLYQAYKTLKQKDISVFDFYKILESKAKELGIDSGLFKRDLNVGFSGGEKKQSELMQLFILEPKFAFLDEIDSGVDVDSMKKIFSGINKLSENGTAVVLVTHHDTIQNYIKPDFVHILDSGKIIRSGGADLASEVAKNGFTEIIKKSL